MATSSPAVSITIAAYNVHEWLEECLNSIVCQTFKDFECIVVDDCSGDITPDIVEAYARKDSRFRLVRHEVNQGLAATRRTGLANCTGKYVWQIDGDDYVATDALEIFHGIAERDGCDIVRGCAVQVENEKLTSLSRLPDVSNHSFSDLYQLVLPQSIWRNFFLRDFVCRFDQTAGSAINLGEDMIFNSFYYTRARRISLTSHTAYFYRIREKSYTNEDLSKYLYLEEAKAHTITYDNFEQFPHVQMQFMAMPSNHRSMVVYNACAHIPKHRALEVIQEYKNVYSEFNPIVVLQAYKRTRSIHWHEKHKYRVLQFAERLHTCHPEFIYDAIMNEL